MLVLSRKSGETIRIGDVELMVLSTSSSRVSLGIQAGREVRILRGELIDWIRPDQPRGEAEK
jgi:carbon storage regulator CsrA